MPEYNWLWIAKNIYEIRRLRFEDFLWIFFICLALVSMYGDHDEIEYLKTGD